MGDLTMGGSGIRSAQRAHPHPEVVLRAQFPIPRGVTRRFAPSAAPSLAHPLDRPCDPNNPPARVPRLLRRLAGGPERTPCSRDNSDIPLSLPGKSGRCVVNSRSQTPNPTCRDRWGSGGRNRRFLRSRHFGWRVRVGSRGKVSSLGFAPGGAAGGGSGRVGGCACAGLFRHRARPPN
jgi:hypothetical protein